MIHAWVAEEFASVDLHDRRLNRRLKLCISDFSGIGESTPDRCRTLASLKATYRLMDNKKVRKEDIFAAHNLSAIERCKMHSKIYLTQDTTEIELTKPKQQVAHAGPLGTDHRRGFFYHPLCAYSEQGLAIGAVDQVLWTRDSNDKRNPEEKRKNIRQLSFEEKESSRWLEMLQSGEQIARSCPTVQFIALADSEADIAELFCEAHQFPDNYNLIIRGCKTRSTTSAVDSRDLEPIAASKLEEALKKASERSHRKVWVSPRTVPVFPDDKKRARKQGREGREAMLTTRAITTIIPGPRRPGGGVLPDITIHVVQAIEENAPLGEEPIHWFLFTTLPIQTEDEINAVLDGYCQRWSIETFFKTLKSGCRVEEMRYETLDRYVVAFSILSIVAWRIEYLKTAARMDSDSPCDKYYPTQHWVAIMTFVNRKRIDPSSPPTMHVFLKTVAQLGGFIDKKSQGPPGSTTIWRGMRRFESIVEAFAIFSNASCGV